MPIHQQPNVQQAKDTLMDIKSQLDSFQQAVNDSIASFQHQLNQLDSSGVAGGYSTNWLLWLLFGLLVICVVWWLFKRRKTNMIIKKDLNPDYDDKSGFSSNSKDATKEPLSAASPCVAAVASGTRKTINQDSYAEAFVDAYKARIIAVADGVGSSDKAEEGSLFVAKKAVELVKQAIVSGSIASSEHSWDIVQIDFDSIFDTIQEDLDAHVESNYQNCLSQIKPTSFATTLIIGIDLPDRFIAAYIGNGSIWHISGLFNTFPQIVGQPWNAINMLNPDTIMDGGKEALYKIFFYKGKKKHHKPTVLQISKLNEMPGDIFIITTDGVYSSDHAVAGRDDAGAVWIPATAQASVLFETLTEYVEGDKAIDNLTLKQMLTAYLLHLKEANIMDDDTTIGVFISDEAKRHFIDKREKNETN